jgi:hypothetical protein
VRYHFNFSDMTRNVADLEGAEFSSLEAAVEDGRLSARELMSLDHGEPNPTYVDVGGRFTIVDAVGAIAAVILFEEALLDSSVR